MKFNIPKKFGIVIKISAIAMFVGYAILTSDVETVHGNTAVVKPEVTQTIIPYESYEQVNNNLDFGEKRVVQSGINGLIANYGDTKIVLQQPQTEIIEYGEKILYRFNGSMTGYGPDCAGCSGRVGAGQNVTNGNIYYNDSKYGKLRIVAADTKLPYGTVIRIRNSRISNEPIMAIVLDRGGAVKGNLIDLLFASSSEIPAGTTQSNIAVDVIRLGY